jgi:hypothetical protein
MTDARQFTVSRLRRMQAKDPVSLGMVTVEELPLAELIKLVASAEGRLTVAMIREVAR